MKKENTTPTNEGLHTRYEVKIFEDGKCIDHALLSGKQQAILIQTALGKINEKPAQWTDKQEKCPTCGTPCQISWSGLELVANTGDETLASKRYTPKAVNERQALLDSHRELLAALKNAEEIIERINDEYREVAQKHGSYTNGESIRIKKVINNAKNIKQ